MKQFFIPLLVIFSFAYSQTFPDNTASWADQEVETLVQLGVLLGYPDGYLHGDQAITRYEASVMFARFLNAIEAQHLTDLSQRIYELEAIIAEIIVNATANDNVLAERFLAEGNISQDLNDAIRQVQLTADTALALAEESTSSTIVINDTTAELTADTALAISQEQEDLLHNQNTKLDDLSTLLNEAYSQITNLKTDIATLRATTTDISQNIPNPQIFADLVEARVLALQSNLEALAEVIQANQETFQQALIESNLLVLDTVDAQIADEVFKLSQQFTDTYETITQEYITYVDERIVQLTNEIADSLAGIEATFGEDLASQAQQITDAYARIQTLEERLNRPATYLWKTKIDVSGGIQGAKGYYKFATRITNNDTAITAHLHNQGGSVQAEYQLTDTISVGARYNTDFSSSLGSIFVGNRFTDAFGIIADLGYGQGLEVGVGAYHLGSSSSAVIPDLTLGLNFRVLFNNKGASATLFDSQAQWKLDFGDFTITPGVILRNVINNNPKASSYRGIIPSIDVTGTIGDIPLYLQIRYGFLFGLNDHTYNRNAPEFTIGGQYRNFTLEGFLDSGLVTYARFPDFIIDPTQRLGYQLGIRANVSLELEGDRVY